MMNASVIVVLVGGMEVTSLYVAREGLCAGAGSVECSGLVTLGPGWVWPRSPPPSPATAPSCTEIIETLS